MKLISLNAWGGKAYGPLIEFIKEHRKDTDIFCFQEMLSTSSDIKERSGYRTNLFQELSNLLCDFKAFYTPALQGYNIDGRKVPFNLETGEAIFVRKNFFVKSTNELPLWGRRMYAKLKPSFYNFPIVLQYICIEKGRKNFFIFNFHGVSVPGDKLDTPRRLKISQKIKKLFDSINGNKIFCGDFNLMPSTQSIAIFEKDMENLIKSWNITRTRGALSPYYGQIDEQKFADYIFVSGEVKVEDFQVPNVDISDHLPMILRFS